MTPRHPRQALWIVSLAWILTANTLPAAPLRNHPVVLSQPNGVALNLYVSGDEYFNWIHDREGYTIIQNPITGYYTYAKMDAGFLVASGFVVGQVDPATLGIPKKIMPAKEQIARLMAVFPRTSSVQGEEISNAPSKGTINNLVVFIRFSDESEFNRKSSYYDSMFNSSTSGQNSMRNYYREVSYEQLTISTTLYPVPAEGYVLSYQDLEPRGYYEPRSATNPIGYTGADNGADRTNREHALLVRAINNIAGQVPSSLDIDGDGDGNVDNVCFIVRGSPGGWNALLWPHAWKLSTQSVTITGKRVLSYSFQLESSLDTDGVGVLCHEMFHNMGATDLYHYSFDGLGPAGPWDIMQADANPPQHMTAYMKHRYGKWITSIPTISSSGTYTLNPLTSSTDSVYRINSPYASTEYFLVEYRKRSTIFEKSLPGEGLIVYRINTVQDGKGNENGPPDELYVFRINGTPTANGDPSRAHFNADEGRIKIDDSTNPYSFLSDGFAGGLKITNIGAIGDTISFTLEGPGTVAAQVTRMGAVSNAAAGGAVQLRVEVKNTGTRPLPPDSAVWFYVQAPGMSGSDIWVGWYPVGNISPAYIDWYGANWKIPKSVYGSAKYWARVYDGSTALSEWSAEQAFTIKGPDPVGSAILSELAVNTPTLGSIAIFYARITNTGSASFSSDVRIWFYLEAGGLSEPWIAYASLYPLCSFAPSHLSWRAKSAKFSLRH